MKLNSKFKIIKLFIELYFKSRLNLDLTSPYFLRIELILNGNSKSKSHLFIITNNLKDSIFFKLLVISIKGFCQNINCF